MKGKWYLQTWFICLMFALWSFYLPVIIGLVLLYLQHKEQSALSAKYGEIDALDEKISNKMDEISLHEQTLAKLEEDKQEAIRVMEKEKQEKNSELQQVINNLNKEISVLQKEIDALNKEAVVASYQYSMYEGISSEECKNKLSLLKVKEKELLKNNNAVKVSSSETKKEINNNIKQMLRCFNAECDNILLGLSAKNIDSQRGKIQKSFETLNKIFSTDGIALTEELLQIKLEQLNLVYTFELKKEQEREQQKAIREQMIEEEKVRREIEREKQKIEKEEKQFKNEINKLMAYMQKSPSDAEKVLYIDKIKELENKLKQLENDKENILQREQNTRAGYVYVISNIGSFGENVYKIGMTRRLEPMERIKELGDASVPFPFDVHAMIFSEDAPALEAILHETFKKYEVNKVNNRKEFFKVPLSEIERVVKEHHNATVTFTLVAEAAEYRESLKLTA
ncbi:DUF4041 domain-containing protein [Desulfoscipio geothermicus]|uniref:Bacteriophage T5 Orf172 DNA-binding domain-containing protein n=1 Tax=Desulfoscipio geothermicus DSM 3669 TaxID=1121426 RepID=A0A1I6ECG5_9FIRM|nr:DUF4041 domain-containing protein [Desulfoscipio geothermicus]SFR15424.1 protein of unknown function [Desulfoscipio geothermicus DSM 3669]